MKKLLEMLTYRRPAGSACEQAFREKFILSVPAAEVDAHLNIVIEVGQGSTTLFSCHTDTVHAKEGIQQVLADLEMGLCYKGDGFPLGADDAAGCWVMLEMIAAGVPGVYIFHHGEERGGIGSSDKAEAEPEWFKRFNRAVAFDRKDESHIITHQSGGRCCSQNFAAALATALNAADTGFEYAPNDGGVFTDTANYIDLVPECTNVSVGYQGEHTKNEILNLDHVQRLALACCAIDWEALPTERDPDEVPSWRLPAKFSKAEQESDEINDVAEELLGWYRGDPGELARALALSERENDELKHEAWVTERELEQLLSEVKALKRQLKTDAVSLAAELVSRESAYDLDR